MPTHSPSRKVGPLSADQKSPDPSSGQGSQSDDCPSSGKATFTWSDTVVISVPGDESAQEPQELPWAERRLYDRFPARPGTRIEIRRLGILTGANLAKDLIDVSEVGVRARLTAAVRRGDVLDVTLWVVGGGWCVRCVGDVRWTVIGPDGLLVAGIELRRPLMPQDFKRLADCGFPAYRPTLGQGNTPG